MPSCIAVSNTSTERNIYFVEDACRITFPQISSFSNSQVINTLNNFSLSGWTFVHSGRVEGNQKSLSKEMKSNIY